MRLAIVTAGLVLGLVGCGGANECERYVDAALACIEAAGGDVTGYSYESTCAGYANDQADYFACLADAYEGADCSTLEGLTAAGTSSASCTL
jgi:hypothetical protein